MTNGNDYAFPQAFEKGLTKREYFAAMALQGLAANSDWAKSFTSDDWDDYVKRIGEASAEIADGLIKALNDKQ